jgi:hypothetical protein
MYACMHADRQVWSARAALGAVTNKRGNATNCTAHAHLAHSQRVAAGKRVEDGGRRKTRQKVCVQHSVCITRQLTCTKQETAQTTSRFVGIPSKTTKRTAQLRPFLSLHYKIVEHVVSLAIENATCMHGFMDDTQPSGGHTRPS